MSLRNRILNYLKNQHPKEINGGEIERLAQLNGYKASNASRRCRELANEGLISRIPNEKGHVEYRFNSELDILKQQDPDFFNV